MQAKKTIEEFYKSDALTDGALMQHYLHPEVILDWHSSKGFLQLTANQLMEMANELGRAYARSKVRISHIVAEKDTVCIRYSHFVKTIENPREEMLLAHFVVVWELMDGKLFRGYQMTQLS